MNTSQEVKFHVTTKMFLCKVTVLAAVGAEALKPSFEGPSKAVVLPIASFFGVMSAPIYGKGFLGGLVNFETMTQRTSPNEYLVAPADACPKYLGGREEAPVFPVNANELKKSFQETFRKRFAISRFAEPTLTKGNQFVYVERTPLLRFPDIINVKFVDLGNSKSTLLLHSGSIYGYSDLGKNKERLQEILRDLPNLPPNVSRNTVRV